jgi:5-methylcytosine-specific restriction endonuclease McrA
MSSIHSRKWRKLREEVFKEYGRACAYCGYEDSVMTVDHIIPRSKNGLDILENFTLPAVNVIIQNLTR